MVMKIEDIQKILEAERLTTGKHPKGEVKSACASDLMSDVLAFSKSSTALLTGLVNPQVIRTAEMLDILCVVFVRGKRPDAETVQLAEELGIALLATKLTMYYAAGRLYEAGVGKA